jgi:hypothetical protein
MKLRDTFWTLVVVSLLCAAPASAQDQRQDQQQDQQQPTSPIDPNAPLQPLQTNPTSNPGYPNRPPVPAARGVSDPYASQPYDPSQVQPDRNTLAGAVPTSLGSLQHSKNTFDPALSFSQVGQTTPGVTGGFVLTGVAVVSGSLNFNRVWREYHFSALYNGGETFNEGYSQATNFFGVAAPHYQFHELSVAQQADWGRWHVILSDDFTASPGATFSGQGFGGPGLSAQFSSILGSSLSNLSQSFVPSENINTAFAMRYRNSVLGQTEYELSRRSTITVAGSYGLLHFTSAGYFSSTMVDAQAGYDYLLDPSDSIAILGSYGQTTYTGIGSTTTDYVGALAYGRKITGRLAFQIAAGPQDILSSNPASLGGDFRILFMSVNSGLTYQRRRSGFSLNYVRGLSGGSGVYLGATSNTVSGSWHYQFTRFWAGSITGGYSLDRSLVPAGVPSTQFDTWFVGANFGRRVGPHAQINFNYGAARQNNPVVCPVGTNCGGTGLQQTFGMSVNWHLRPTG